MQVGTGMAHLAGHARYVRRRDLVTTQRLDHDESARLQPVPQALGRLTSGIIIERIPCDLR